MALNRDVDGDSDDDEESAVEKKIKTQSEVVSFNMHKVF